MPEYCFVQPTVAATNTLKPVQAIPVSQRGGKDIQVKVRLYPGVSTYNNSVRLSYYYFHDFN